MSRKIPKILRKNHFRKKNFFFLMEKIMLIVRFPHSFRVWGCWGRSNIAYFAIFRGFRCLELASAALLVEACPSVDFSKNKKISLCRFTREYHGLLRSKTYSTVIPHHSAMSRNRLTVPYMIGITYFGGIARQKYIFSCFNEISGSVLTS